MKWFKKLTLANKLAFIGIIISIVSILIGVFSSYENRKNIKVHQETTGDNSPVVNTKKDVYIKY